MLAFPAVWAFTYVSASFWSVLRLRSALAFDAKATPARTIEQTMRVTLTFSLLICACLPGFFASIECPFSRPRPRKGHGNLPDVVCFSRFSAKAFHVMVERAWKTPMPGHSRYLSAAQDL